MEEAGRAGVWGGWTARASRCPAPLTISPEPGAIPAPLPPPQPPHPPQPPASGGAASAPVPPRAAPLLGLEWSLGVPIASSASSAPAGAPFVTVQLRVGPGAGAPPGAPPRVEAVEMTLAQARAFEAALREAAEALDRA
jgi:hypothetical protein